MERPDARCRVVVLAATPDARALVRSGDGALPETVIIGDAGATPTIEAAIATLLGDAGMLLRVTTLEVDERTDPTLLAVETVLRDGATPPGFTWAPLGRVAPPVGPPSLMEALRWWRGRLDGAATPLDPPWTAPGWFERATAWMLGRMAEAGSPATAPPRFHGLWPISAILVAASDAGRVFLKASPSVFAAEASVTATLAARTPGSVTPVLAIEPAEGWLLMRDLGERILGDEPATAWPVGLGRLAELQVAWARHTAELAAAGARRRPLDALAATVPGLAEDQSITAALEEEDRARLLAAVPRLVDACLRLGEMGPPDTLVHGDLHPWNVVQGDGGPVLFDWSDATIGHPFLDLVPYVTRTDDLDARRAMIAAYLAPWREHANGADLEAAARLAMPVGCAFQAHTYQILLAGLDPHDHPWFHAADAKWLSAAVAALDTGFALRGGQ